MVRDQVRSGFNREKIMQAVFLGCACISIIAVIIICVFLFASGLPAIAEIGPLKFLLGTKWKPENDIYGIWPMIVGSVYITGGSALIGVPIGILSAVFMAYFCPKKIYGFLKPSVDLLAGIPSIVYGFFGLGTIAPLIMKYLGGKMGSLLAACILLGIMILPSIISTAEASLKAVPDSYYEGARALGATHERSVFLACLPAAKSGVLAGVILGIGRAIGETMAVVMVAGNSPVIPDSITSGVRTMTGNIVIEMGYATGLHRQALIATACVLFVFILIINLCFSALKRKEKA